MFQDFDDKFCNIHGIVRIDMVAADPFAAGNYLLAKTRRPPRPDNDRFSHRHRFSADDPERFVF